MSNLNPRQIPANVYPDGGIPDHFVISSLSEAAAGDFGIAHAAGAVASAVYPVASLALFIPFTVAGDDRPYRVYSKIIWNNGAAVSGNIDVGVYDAKGNKLASAGSTAQAGTTAPQVFSFATPLKLVPGRYYLAIAMDNVTGTLARIAPTAASVRCMGLGQMAAAFPLPATATIVGSAQSYIPWFTLVEGSFA